MPHTWNHWQKLYLGSNPQDFHRCCNEVFQSEVTRGWQNVSRPLSRTESLFAVVTFQHSEHTLVRRGDLSCGEGGYQNINNVNNLVTKQSRPRVSTLPGSYIGITLAKAQQPNHDTKDTVAQGQTCAQHQNSHNDFRRGKESPYA